MKFFKTLTIFLITSTVAFSQNASVLVSNSPEQKEYPDELITAKYVGVNFKSMRQQFNENWRTGEIVLTDGKVFKNQRIRFNNFLNELVWLRESDYKIGVVAKESVKEFTYYPENGLPGATYKKLTFARSLLTSEKDLYVQMLVEEGDTIVCLRKFNKIGQTDEYSLSNQYFLLRNGEYLRFYLHRSSIYSLYLAEENKKMKSIIRSNHLRVRKEAQMIKAFELYYNNI
jgi:hypothetical protein